MWQEDLPPFQLYGKLWHVGGKSSPSYLFDTGDGLLLLDTGLPKSGYILFRNIYDLGFKPRDIRWILHSHGHYDHIGMTRALVEMTGAKTYIGAPDRDFVNGTRDLPRAKFIDYSFDEPFEPDVLIHGGDVLNFGSLEIRCEPAPGHTPGTMAFFFDVKEGEKTYHVGYYGGVGFLSVYREFLAEYNLPLSLREDFFRSLDKVYNEKVDVVLGNHPSQNGTLEKRAKMIENPNGENPFISPTEWREFLDTVKERLRVFVDMGY